MPRSRFPRSFATFLFFSLILLGTPAVGGILKVGVLFHLSGDLASFGIVQKNSFQIAFQEAQKQFHDGSTVELVFKDIPTQPEKAHTTVEELISHEGVSLIISGLSSLVAWEAASVAQAHKIPILMSAATEDKITEQGWEYVFRLNPPFSEYGNGLLWFLSEVVKPRTIAILRARGFTGMLNATKIMEHYKKAGFEIVFDHIYDEKSSDIRPVLRQIGEIKPDVVAMASYLDDAVHIIQQCKELKIHPLMFVGLGGGFALPRFGERVSDVGNYIFSISGWNASVPYAGSKEFYEIYQKQHNAKPSLHGANAYAAVQVLADVLLHSPQISPKALRDTLVHTDIASIIGPIKFVSYGKKMQQNRVPTYLVQWFDGEMKTVWPPRLACRRYVYPFPGWPTP